jgi:hypothetical protein
MGQTWSHVRWEWSHGRSVGWRFFLETALDSVRWARCAACVGLTAWNEHWQLQRRIRGCASCSRVHLPGESYYSCGACDDGDHDLCVQCFRDTKKTSAGAAPLSSRAPLSASVSGSGAAADGARGARSLQLSPPQYYEHPFHQCVFPLCVAPATAGCDAAQCTSEAMSAAFKRYASRSLFGVRQRVVDGGGHELLDDYEWTTYREVEEQALSLGTELQRLTRSGGGFVGVLGSMCPEWLFADYACVLKGCPVVLMHRATTPAQLAHIMRETRLAVLVVSRHLRPIVCQALLDVAAVCNGSGTTTTSPTTTASSGGGGGNLPHIVWFTDNADAHLHVAAANVDDTNTLADLGVTESDFVEALAAGAGAPIDIRTAIHVASPDTVVKLLPSSGSTGMPKLVVVTDAALFRSVQSASQPRGGYVDPLPTVVYAYEVMRQSHDVLVSGDCRTLCHKPLIDNSVYSHYLFQAFGAFLR